MPGEHGRCIDCGRHTPLRLPRRFPHICGECLFTPLDPADSHQNELPDSVEVPSLVQGLYQRASTIARLDIPFGRKGVPRGPGDRLT